MDITEVWVFERCDGFVEELDDRGGVWGGRGRGEKSAHRVDREFSTGDAEEKRPFVR
jgi:hypothetical protein